MTEARAGADAAPLRGCCIGQHAMQRYASTTEAAPALSLSPDSEARVGLVPGTGVTMCGQKSVRPHSDAAPTVTLRHTLGRVVRAA